MMYRNSEGYADTTAGAAFSNIGHEISEIEEAKRLNKPIRYFTTDMEEIK